LKFPGLESPGKGIDRSWKTLEKSWNSKLVVLEMLISDTSIAAFGLGYCSAVTPITDLVCALFGPHSAMFVN